MKFEEFSLLFPHSLPNNVTESVQKAIEQIDASLFASQLLALKSPTRMKIHVEPIHCDTLNNLQHPRSELYGKKLGCIVMAGGQATRLRATLPKGVLPFDRKTGASLFSRIAKKLISFGNLYGETPSLAIMTSDHTETATKRHFSEHKNFDLQDLSFFNQPSLPLITLSEQLAVDDSGNVLFGPDGNGSLFRSFAASGLLQKWINQRIEAVSIIMIDNPLLDPFHPGLCLPIFSGKSMTAGAILRKESSEKVGLFVRKNSSIDVLEYSEIDPALQTAKAENGSLLYNLANISFFITTLDSITKLSSITTQLHAAKKQINGKTVWKSEYFIFDLLPHVHALEIVPIDRNLYFAPIKDPHSFAEAQERSLNPGYYLSCALTVAKFVEKLTS